MHVDIKQTLHDCWARWRYALLSPVYLVLLLSMQKLIVSQVPLV